jgi:hypothetical protein
MSAFRQTPAPARILSLTGVAFLAIGAIAYLAVPGWSGTSAASAGTHAPSASAGTSGQPTLPGPMPGAPTQQPTTPAVPTPSGGPQVILDVTPTALRPSNPMLVKAWNSGRGGDALATVTALSSNALLAKTLKQYPDMLQDCKALSTATGNAEQAGLIPDVAMEAKYVVALGLFKLAAVSCIAGIREVPVGVEDTVTDVNQTVVDTVASELSSGVSDLFGATGMLRKVSSAR